MGHNTSTLDRVIADQRLRNKATVLVIVCPRDHVLARVFLAGGELAYVSRTRSPILGIVENGVVAEPTSRRTLYADEYVDYLDATEHPGFDPGLEAECHCSRAIFPRSWVREQIKAGVRRAVAPLC